MNKYLIYETPHFTISQADGYRIPGYIIILSKAKITNLSDFNQEQSADLLQCLAKAESLVQEIQEPERIYIMKFGEVNPVVHFHVFPRTKKIGDAYSAQVDDAEPYNGSKLIDWIWANHESLGYSDEEIEGFINEARKKI